MSQAPGHRNRFNRWAITGECSVCGIAVTGRLDGERRPRHPDFLTDSMRAQAVEPPMLTTTPVHERCPHCQAAVVELWLHGLFTSGSGPADRRPRPARAAGRSRAVPREHRRAGLPANQIGRAHV